MAKINVIASPHGKDYDKLRASHLAKGGFEAFFMELEPGVIERIGPGPNEASYNLAKENSIFIHFVDNPELGNNHDFIDKVADRVAYSILGYHLRNAGFNIQHYLTGEKFEENGKTFEIVDVIPFIPSEPELRNTVDLLSTAYQASLGCIRERSFAIAKNTASEIRKNNYKNSALECGNAHYKDIVDALTKEGYEVELIVLGDEDYRYASYKASRELRELQQANNIEIPQNIRDDMFNRRRLDQEAYMKFIEHKIPLKALTTNLYEVYKK